MRNYKAAIIPAAVTIACLMLFINKAFNLDDPLFLWAAKHIQTHPADFYGFQVNWYGYDLPMAKVAQNPPLACYYIALVASLFGFSEIALHIAFLIPAAAVAVGTYCLAAKFCSRPILAALAAVLTPGFLVSSSNIMCDTMMLAFWVWAIFFWVEGIETNKHSSLFLAALLVAICSLTKYFGMALLPLLLVYSLMQKRKLGTWLLYLLMPVVILAGYQWLTIHLYGRGLLLDAAAYVVQYDRGLSSKFFLEGFTGLLFTGGCIVVALFYCPLLWSRRVLIIAAAVIILFILLLSFAKKIGEIPVKVSDSINWSFLIQIGFMAASGFTVLALAVMDFFKRRDAASLLLLLWVFGTFIFASVINWTVNARSVLPMVPAVGILLMRRIDLNKNKAALTACLPLLPAALVALLVCFADYTWAGTARLAADTLHKKYENTGHTLWFEGHWGFQYYMEALGFKAFDLNHPEKSAAGDFLVLPANSTNIAPLPDEATSRKEFLQFYPCPYLATMNKHSGAGFYTDIWGPLPFAAGTVEPEKYFVFIINPSAESPKK